MARTRLRLHAHREWEKRLSPPTTLWRTAYAELLGLSCRESVETARLHGYFGYSILLRASMCPLIIWIRIHCYVALLDQQVFISVLLGSSKDLLSVCYLMKQVTPDRLATLVQASMSLIVVGSTSVFTNTRAFGIRYWSAGSEVTTHRPLYTSCFRITLKSIIPKAQKMHIASLVIPSDHGHTGILQKGDRFNPVMSFNQKG